MPMKKMIKDSLKMLMQEGILPKLYKYYENKTEIEKGRVLFADSNHKGLSKEMKAIYMALKKRGYKTEVYSGDIRKMDPATVFRFMKTFMKKYARAEYVFISNYFVPVSACDKREGTKVIQLWHAAGALKKMGFDAEDDIAKYYKGNPAKNFDLVTVSSDYCRQFFKSAFKLTDKEVKATGIARTDEYFSKRQNDKKIENFYFRYPQAKGKKICLYAPSFSGNASAPECKGLDAGIIETMNKLKDEWFFLVSLHPHLRKLYPEYNMDISTEDMFPVCNLLITDYSSVVFDYSLYKKSMLFFVPDLKEYEEQRGFYNSIETFPGKIVKNSDDLYDILISGEWKCDEDELKCFKDKYMAACDGHASIRILKEAGLLKEEENGKEFY